VLWQIFIIGSLEQRTVEITPKIKLNICGNDTVTDENTGVNKRFNAYSALYINYIIKSELIRLLPSTRCIGKFPD
jgi:hypothetical protein